MHEYLLKIKYIYDKYVRDKHVSSKISQSRNSSSWIWFQLSHDHVHIPAVLLWSESFTKKIQCRIKNTHIICSYLTSYQKRVGVLKKLDKRQVKWRKRNWQVCIIPNLHKYKIWMKAVISEKETQYSSITQIPDIPFYLLQIHLSFDVSLVSSLSGLSNTSFLKAVKLSSLQSKFKKKSEQNNNFMKITKCDYTFSSSCTLHKYLWFRANQAFDSQFLKINFVKEISNKK